MIEKEGRTYTVYCDFCSNFLEDYPDFMSAVEGKSANGWTAVKQGDEWYDKCPECLEKELS